MVVSRLTHCPGVVRVLCDQDREGGHLLVRVRGERRDLTRTDQPESQDRTERYLGSTTATTTSSPLSRQYMTL